MDLYNNIQAAATAIVYAIEGKCNDNTSSKLETYIDKKLNTAYVTKTLTGAYGICYTQEALVPYTNEISVVVERFTKGDKVVGYAIKNILR